MNDIKNAKLYIKTNLDSNVEIDRCKKSSIPLYLTNTYDIYNCVMIDKPCTLLIFRGERLVIEDLKKHIIALSKLGCKNATLVLDNARLDKRRLLIENKIPFIIAGKQAYLPFIYLDIDNQVNYFDNRKEFTPSEQLVFIYLLKTNLNNFAQLTKNLGVSAMTVSRAFNHFLNLGLVEVTGSGTRKKFHIQSIERTWEKGSQYLINPVAARYFIPQIPDGMKTLYSSESALAEYSMLGYPKEETVAINKSEQKKYSDELNDNMKNRIFEISSTYGVSIEVWKYDPFLLADNGSVDIFSLYAQLQNSNDARIERELDRLIKEGIKCGD